MCGVCEVSGMREREDVGAQNGENRIGDRSSRVVVPYGPGT